MECWVKIRLREGLHDPEGQAVLGVAQRLGCSYLQEARVGKLVILRFPDGDRQRAEEEVKKLVEELLINPLIEEYTIQWQPS